MNHIYGLGVPSMHVPTFDAAIVVLVGYLVRVAGSDGTLRVEIRSSPPPLLEIGAVGRLFYVVYDPCSSVAQFMQQCLQAACEGAKMI